MNSSKVVKNISPIWLDYLSHIINNSGPPFKLCFAPTMEGTKSILTSAGCPCHQDKLGVRLTLRGYLNNHWFNTLQISKDDLSPTPEEWRQWSKLATNQIWSLLMRVLGERNEIFHKEQNITIAHSEINAKIIRVYAQRGRHVPGTLTYSQQT